MRELAEGVYQLEVPMRHNPLGYTYSYLLRDAATIIDTGVGTNQAFTRLSEQLRSIGLAVADLRRIILTPAAAGKMWPSFRKGNICWPSRRSNSNF